MTSLRVVAAIGLLLGPSTALAFDGEAASPRPFGLERRLPWNDSRLVGSPDPLPPYKTARAFPNLVIKQPLVLAPEPGTDRLFVLNHQGGWAGPSRVFAIRDDQAVSEPEQLLQVEGLAVGMTFHPNYVNNGYLYLGRNAPSRALKGQKATQVVRFTVDRKPPHRIDPNSMVVIIEWASNGHDGGDVAFDNDGYLYATAGDGSSGSDAHETGQRLDDLLGSVIRIDVDHPDPGRLYSVPRDNPFVARKGARPELWAYGLRNPWRMSYDAPSGQLWVGQNGQDLWEQVYLIKKGGNYGWSLTEGSHVFYAQRPAGPDPILPPTAEHSHGEARSLTGGRVYRGTRLPDLVGAYIYGDWSTGHVWGMKHDGTRALWHKELVDTPFNITGFGTDHAGELYVIDHTAGTFHRFEPTTEADRPKQPFPTHLSETGLFSSVADLKPHPAAIAFEVNAPQWADGASGAHLIALSGLEKVLQRAQLNAGGAWTLPEGSAAAQTLSLNVIDDASGKPVKRRIETRVLVRQQGEWVGYSYRWNPQQSDADLVASAGLGVELEVPDAAAPGGRREQTWRFPSRSECLVCHSRAAGFLLGFTPPQLDRDHDYGGTIDNQLRTFEHVGMYQGTLPKRSERAGKLVNPYDTSAPTEARVKSYLHVNCSGCHVGEGGGNARMELSFGTSLNGMRLLNETPIHDRFNLPDAKLVAPGAPDRSVLYHRISRRGSGQMPPLVSTEVDHEAVKLIGDWIRSLPANGR